MNNLLYDKAKEIGVELSDDQLSLFERYYNLLIEWNEKVNLTAITDYEDVIIKHFVDSISLCKVIDLNKDSSLIDVGCGAGFPGIPLKIAFPQLKITLLDSLNKRVDFLNLVISELGLKDICAVHGRAEDYGRDKEYREQFDICVSRAVANLSTLSEYCVPFVKLDGLFIPYKSEKASAEIKEANNALDKLFCVIKDVCEFVLPGTDNNRSLLVIKKEKSTPAVYPRKAGTPSKKPL